MSFLILINSFNIGYYYVNLNSQITMQAVIHSKKLFDGKL